LPVQLAYELGLTGLLLSCALPVLFFIRRMGERQEGRDPALLAAGLLGLMAGAVAALGSGALAVTALPVAGVVAAGAALAGSGRGKARPESPWPVWGYAVLVLLVLFPLERAHWHYDRAVASDLRNDSPRAEDELAEAMGLDPSFPLYPARLAMLLNRRPGANPSAAAELALRGAGNGRGVPSLWMIAGILGYTAQRPWAGDALDRACRLDSFNPIPPFYQLLNKPGGPDAAAYGAHALLAEPKLAAALFWERHPPLLGGALKAIETWPGVDAGWKQALLAATTETGTPPPQGTPGPVEVLPLVLDTAEAETISLPVFRRRQWPARWGLVQVRSDVLARFNLPPAAAAPATSVVAFAAVPCRRRSVREQELLRP
jgi:hypothetical protein